MEWDKFWAENKRVLEDSSARYMGVAAGEDVVELHLTTPEGVPQAEEYHSIPIHPLKPAMGTRVITYAPVVLIDQADASTLTAGEEVTLLRWGNILLTDVTVVDGKVKSMRGVTQPNAVDFTKTKKLTWLAKTEHMVKATLVEFDHLISKGKLADDEVRACCLLLSVCAPCFPNDYNLNTTRQLSQSIPLGDELRSLVSHSSVLGGTGREQSRFRYDLLCLLP